MFNNFSLRTMVPISGGVMDIVCMGNYIIVVKIIFSHYDDIYYANLS